VVALAAAACEAKYTVLDFSCGPLKLRLEQTRHRSFEIGDSWSESILLSRPSGWVELQAVAHRTGAPETFSRLLPAAVAFQSVPAAPTTGPPRPGVTVYIDPAVVSREEYDVLASCLAKNAAAIEKNFAAGPMDKDASSATKPAPLRIAATLYTRREDEFMFCGRALGTRWDCADGQGYIKTVTDQEQGQLILCRIDPPTGPGPGQGSGMMTVGQLSPDQKTVSLATPTPYDSETVLHGKEPKAYYATCRDASGKGFYETLTPVGDPGPSAATSSLRGKQLFDAGRYDEALAVYREAARAAGNPWDHYQAGRCLDKLGRGKEALDAFRKAVERSPDNPDFHYEVASHLYEQHKYKEAIEHYRRITVLEPTVAGGYTNLGMALGAAGRHEEALKQDREAVRLKPDALAYHNLGVALHNLGRTREAIEAYRNAVELTPGYADARHALAGELLAANQPDEAVVQYEALARLEPATSRGLAGQGMVLQRQGRCAEAVTIFAKADRLCRDCMGPGENAAYQDCYNRTHR
jgi:tetratricopeptide (TPR) repeat protein